MAELQSEKYSQVNKLITLQPFIVSLLTTLLTYSHICIYGAYFDNVNWLKVIRVKIKFKLSYRREAARCLVLLSILVSR